jgi:lipopolysaccharide export system permease protein
MTLTRHVVRLVGGRILAALAVLVGILQILDLLDVTTDILDRRLGIAGVAYYAALRMPRLIEQAAPLAVLAGCLFAFTQLARESAVTAMRSTGMSAYRLTAMAAPAAVLILLLQLAMGAWVAPRTDSILTRWWRATTPATQVTNVAPRTFRVGGEIVVAAPVDDSGRRLKDVTIYRRDAEGRLLQRTVAPSATYENGRWRLTAPRFDAIGLGAVQQSSAKEMAWTNRLNPTDVRTLFSQEQSISPGSARRALEGGASARPRSFYATQLQRIWAAPFAALVMLLLAAPAALANFRSGRGATLLIISLAAGLVFLVIDGIFTALGESGAAPAVLAAWSAPIIFAGLGATALLYLEG